MGIVCGHRGFGSTVFSGVPENTPDSMVLACNAGVAWVEMDARLTSDGMLVSSHNPELPDGRLIRNLSAAEVRRNGIFLVSDLLDAVPDHVGVNLDVKTGTRDALVSWEQSTGGMVCSLLRSYPVKGREVLVTAFDASVPVRVKAAHPGVQVGLLGWLWFPLRKLIPAASGLGLDAVAFHVGSVDGNDVDQSSYMSHVPIASELAAARQAGLRTLCYCPTPEETVLLFDAGLDIACVNDVPGVVATRQF
jgi:glycerophosphoryl diester phosphodiesterase